jgi:hypothetical protein
MDGDDLLLLYAITSQYQLETGEEVDLLDQARLLTAVE